MKDMQDPQEIMVFQEMQVLPELQDHPDHPVICRVYLLEGCGIDLMEVKRDQDGTEREDR